MKNQSMKRKLETGEAIDLSPFPRTPEGYVIMPMPPVPNEDKDFCDYCLADTEEWIWWIVREPSGRIVAGTLLNHLIPDGERLWIR